MVASGNGCYQLINWVLVSKWWQPLIISPACGWKSLHPLALRPLVGQPPHWQSQCVVSWHGSWLMCPVAQASEQKCLFPLITAVASSTLHVHGAQSHWTRIGVMGISEIDFFGLCLLHTSWKVWQPSYKVRFQDFLGRFLREQISSSSDQLRLCSLFSEFCIHDYHCRTLIVDVLHSS